VTRQLDLFAGTADRTDLLGDEIVYWPALFDPATSGRLESELHATTAWSQHRITMFGRPVDVPRLSAWHGERRTTYSYSGLALHPEPWTPSLLEVKQRIEAELGTTFNSALVNLYRDGRDSVAWHGDDEDELGPEPIIASVTFGEVRRFRMRRRADHDDRIDLDLAHGSLLVMRGTTQRQWEHAVPKSARSLGPRINLTYRQIIPSGVVPSDRASRPLGRRSRPM